MLKKLDSIKNCHFISACKGCNLAFTTCQLSISLVSFFCSMELDVN